MYTNVGKIGSPLEITKVGAKETSCLKFSMAFDYGFGDKKRTEWLNVIAWGNRAETISTYCEKGDSLFVILEPNTSKWETAEGKKMSKTEWHIDSFKFIGSSSKKKNELTQPKFSDTVEDSLPF